MAVSRLPLIGKAVRLRRMTGGHGRAGLRRRTLPVSNVARLRLRRNGDRWAGHRRAELGARFAAADGGGIGGEPVGAARAPIVRPARIRSKMLSVHLRPVERAVACRRGNRILPAEFAPLALDRGTEALLHRRDAIRHAAAVPGIVLLYDRSVDDYLAIHDDVGDVDDGDVAPPSVAAVEEKS